jgi:hypothetical protein
MMGAGGGTNEACACTRPFVSTISTVAWPDDVLELTSCAAGKPVAIAKSTVLGADETEGVAEAALRGWAADPHAARERKTEIATSFTRICCSNGSPVGLVIDSAKLVGPVGVEPTTSRL